MRRIDPGSLWLTAIIVLAVLGAIAFLALSGAGAGPHG